MCDTLVALPSVTKTGTVLFAKNSDREPNEACQIVVIEAADHQPNEYLDCTYIKIPQVSHTNRVLLSKPHWMWGAEVGANEWGLTIGNEAVFSKEPYGKEPGLIGMDYLRLALERCSSADQALEFITKTLAEYGQSGNCGYDHLFFYHNSFLIADPSTAWVLETAGQEWAAVRVKDIATISNVYSIRGTGDLHSDNLVSHAIEKGYCRNKTEFDFYKTYVDFVYSTFGAGRFRQSCSKAFLAAKKGEITPQLMCSALRLHKDGEDFRPDRGLTGATVCMHASYGPIRGSQTVGSMVSELKKHHSNHWLTGTAAPCLSIFKPIWLEAGLDPKFSTVSPAYEPSNMFWKHEQLHRKVLEHYPSFYPSIRKKFDDLESDFLEKAAQISEAEEKGKRDFTDNCFMQSKEATDQLYQNLLEQKIADQAFLHRTAWNNWNRKIHLPV